VILRVIRVMIFDIRLCDFKGRITQSDVENHHQSKIMILDVDEDVTT